MWLRQFFEESCESGGRGTRRMSRLEAGATKWFKLLRFAEEGLAHPNRRRGLPSRRRFMKRREVSLRTERTMAQRSHADCGWVGNDEKAEASFGAEKGAARRSALRKKQIPHHRSRQPLRPLAAGMRATGFGMTDWGTFCSRYRMSTEPTYLINQFGRERSSSSGPLSALG